MSLPVADTITEFQAVDSLAVEATTDSLAFQSADSLSVATTPVWDAAAVYGTLSEPVAGRLIGGAAEQSPLVGNVWFQIITLVAVGLYCLMIYYYREQARLCLKGIFTFKTEDRFMGEHGHLYNNFIALAVMLCTLSVAIALTKELAVWIDPPVVASAPKWAVPLVSGVLWAVVAVVLLVQWAFLKAAGGFTFSGKFAGAVTEIKNTHLAVTTLFLTPAILLWTGVNPVWDTIMFWAIVMEGTLLLVSFVFRTFLLFVGQKVSLLVWILYLCAVEIFPIALVWTLVAKNF
jgi:hypothetical protein